MSDWNLNGYLKLEFVFLLPFVPKIEWQRVICKWEPTQRLELGMVLLIPQESVMVTQNTTEETVQTLGRATTLQQEKNARITHLNTLFDYQDGDFSLFHCHHRFQHM